MITLPLNHHNNHHSNIYAYTKQLIQFTNDVLVDEKGIPGLICDIQLKLHIALVFL